MEWKKLGKYAEQSSGDYIVCAYKRIRDDGWDYECWGPDTHPGMSHWKWHEAHCTLATRPLGAPTPRRRHYLGTRATVEAARALCASHAAERANAE